MCKQCTDKHGEFHVPEWTVSQVKNAIPERLFARSATASLYYTARDIVMAASLAYGAWKADTLLGEYRAVVQPALGVYISAARALVWCTYWWFQGLTFTGLWVIAHECGHSAFSSSTLLNDTVGFVLHSFLGTPYFSWKFSHRQHHRYNGHIEKDEHWIPKSVDENAKEAHSDVWDFVEDTPIYQIAHLLFQQFFGFQGYLLFNISGQPHYPSGTNHYDPYSPLFRKEQRPAIAASTGGILLTLFMLSVAAAPAAFGPLLPHIGLGADSALRAALGSGLGAGMLWKLYGIPWFLLNHWITMIVFLQHTDAALPHYRSGAWTYARGALATVDRAFLGWQGMFFLHGVAHYHVVHHFFPKMPFYNLEEATAHAKTVLGRDYYSCDTPVFKALWDNHWHCQYVDAKGDIVFYKDKSGSALVHVPLQPETDIAN